MPVRPRSRSGTACPRSDLEHAVLRRAALERPAVHLALDVEGDPVPGPRRARHLAPFAPAFAQRLDHAIDVGVLHPGGRAAHLDGFELVEPDLREHLEHRGVPDPRAGRGLHGVDHGLAGPGGALRGRGRRRSSSEAARPRPRRAPPHRSATPRPSPAPCRAGIRECARCEPGCRASCRSRARPPRRGARPSCGARERTWTLPRPAYLHLKWDIARERHRAPGPARRQLVRKERFELSRVAPLAPKASASTDSATFATLRTEGVEYNEDAGRTWPARISRRDGAPAGRPDRKSAARCALPEAQPAPRRSGLREYAVSQRAAPRPLARKSARFPG